jgi:uridine monophosphate synthetase
MIAFFTMLEERAKQTGSLLCVGLDPHPADLPAQTALAARDFCLRLIEKTADVALAYKPNAAFFEIYGSEGWKALAEVIAAAPHGTPMILDAKRGDISSTADAYAKAAFETLKAQCITLSPYLGHDSLQPFIKDPEKGIFLLCKTSNPSSGDLQDITLAGENYPLTLYQKVAKLAAQWNTANNIGVVAGATHPNALRKVRQAAPDLWILAPGVGAQGGDLQAALQAGLRSDGLGMLIPVSRGVACDPDPHAAAKKLMDEINKERKVVISQAVLAEKEPAVPPALAEGLLQAGCIRFGNFTLKSGLQSPIYIDLRQLVTYPKLLAEVASAYITLLKGLKYDRLAALPYAALPIATAISLQTGEPMLYPRKEVKDYGTKAEIEGEYKEGEKVVVIDDLTTTGGSKFEAIEKLTAAGLKVEDVVVLVDRQSGAAEALQQAGIKLHAVLTLSRLIDYWEKANRIPAEQIQAVREFLKVQPG